MLIGGILLALTAVVLIARTGASNPLKTRPLGWMSEQWLAEHRTSDPV